MGLAKTIKIGGIPLGYHRICFLMVDVNQLNTIEILSYLNEEERNRDGDLNDPPYKLQWSVETEYDPFMSVNSAYTHLKTLAEFDGADDIIDEWAVGKAYYIGDMVMYQEQQYECLQSHTSQEGYEPPDNSALWSPYSEGGDGIPVWVQPESTNPYMSGDKVHYPTANDPVYVSTIDYNVYAPNVYGWELYTS